MLTYFQDPKTTLYAVVVAVVLSLIVGIMIGLYGFNKSGFGSTGSPVATDSNTKSYLTYPDVASMKYEFVVNKNDSWNSKPTDTSSSPSLSTLIRQINNIAKMNYSLMIQKGKEAQIVSAALYSGSEVPPGRVRVTVYKKNIDGSESEATVFHYDTFAAGVGQAIRTRDANLKTYQELSAV